MREQRERVAEQNCGDCENLQLQTILQKKAPGRVGGVVFIQMMTLMAQMRKLRSNQAKQVGFELCNISFLRQDHSTWRWCNFPSGRFGKHISLAFASPGMSETPGSASSVMYRGPLSFRVFLQPLWAVLDRERVDLRRQYEVVQGQTTSAVAPWSGLCSSSGMQ